MTVDVFKYEDGDLTFVADPREILICHVFLDRMIGNNGCWCANVSVAEAYTKIRFDSQASANKFAAAVAAVKQSVIEAG
jgi:hypothetical protein